jgi:hypothetical protein
MSGTDTTHATWRRCKGLVSGAVLASLLGLTACAGPGLGDNAGIAVQGSPDGVLQVAWDAQHPWANQMRQQSARYHLYAQYVSGGRPVEQDLGTASATPDGNGMRFLLPQALKAPPESSVCLFIGGGRASGALPVRLASADGRDTARFRFPAWEAQARLRTTDQLAQREDSALERQIAFIEGQITPMRAALQQAGLQTREDCQRLHLKNASIGQTTPADVIAPPQQGDKAQQICVRRARNMRINYKIDLPRMTQGLLADKTLAGNDRRRPLGARFLEQWQAWIDRTGMDYVPEIGPPDETLPLSGTTIEVLKAYMKSGSADDLREATTGLLDGYAGCLEDVGKQLRVKHEAWDKARRMQPERDRLYLERKQAECTTRFDELARAEQDLQVKRSTLAQRQAPNAVAPGSIPPAAGTQILNDLTCTVSGLP